LPAEPDPLDIAAQALRHRDRSRAQIAARLERAGVDAERTNRTLETLERVGYVDDTRFAAARAAALAERGFGDAAIRHDLEASGVQQDAVAEALAGLTPEAERAVALAAHLGRTPKTAARLARKGFAEESIEVVLGSCPREAPSGADGV
jgi:SOS response regulatory protein OraA/RecX